MHVLKGEDVAGEDVACLSSFSPLFGITNALHVDFSVKIAQSKKGMLLSG